MNRFVLETTDEPAVAMTLGSFTKSENTLSDLVFLTIFSCIYQKLFVYLHIEKKVQEYRVKNQLKQIRIMDYKKLILYFGLTSPVIGVRECLHDWQEGDVINTDGVKTEIYAVINRTEENMNTLVSMFKELNTNTSMGILKNFDPDEDETWMFGEDEDIVPYMVCNQWTVKKRQWKDYEKMLDYMEECVDRIV